jgi:hypothetical protein
MIYQVLYSISLFLHIIALFYGVKTLKEGDSIFKNSKVQEFFKSRIERKRVATIILTAGNFLAILVKIPYIMVWEGESTGVLEPLWVMTHLTLGMGLALSHFILYERVKEASHERAN